MTNKDYGYHTAIWRDEPEPDNPFAARASYCHGYDVYGEILQKASWAEYIYVLFMGERPSAWQEALLEKLAVCLVNPGPRELSVRAAMNGGVAGSPHAASLMSALAVGSGQYGGSHEVYLCMQLWQQCGQDLARWNDALLKPPVTEQADIWPAMEHAPGFDPNGETTPTPVSQSLTYLATFKDGGALAWLRDNHESLAGTLGYPLAMSGIAAAAFVDLGMDEHQATMLYLIMRLPGAAAHALEQRRLGWKKFPFYAEAIELQDDPGPKNNIDLSGITL
ncbi:MAG: citryl-CoA lyase [Marinobacter sp.]|nr:citryl-CoA lyase [Marinobacter sp.]